jgi:hypothetical protein
VIRSSGYCVINESKKLKAFCLPERAQQINGHERKTAILLSGGLFTLTLPVAVLRRVISAVMWLNC